MPRIAVPRPRSPRPGALTGGQTPPRWCARRHFPLHPRGEPDQRAITLSDHHQRAPSGVGQVLPAKRITRILILHQMRPPTERGQQQPEHSRLIIGALPGYRTALMVSTANECAATTNPSKGGLALICSQGRLGITVNAAESTGRGSGSGGRTAGRGPNSAPDPTSATNAGRKDADRWVRGSVGSRRALVDVLSLADARL